MVRRVLQRGLENPCPPPCLSFAPDTAHLPVVQQHLAFRPNGNPQTMQRLTPADLLRRLREILPPQYGLIRACAGLS
jgi:hypothetical protein